jgi:hypothetical protein
MEITAYLHHIELDKKVVTMCHGDFKQLLKPDNVICQLLLAHDRRILGNEAGRLP